MSFILDALRRAEAERARGSVPGLHSPPADLLPVASTASRRGLDRPGWWWVGGLLLVGVAGLAWWLGRGSIGPAASPAIPASLPPPVAVAPPPPLPTDLAHAPAGPQGLPAAADPGQPPASPGAGPAAAIPVVPSRADGAVPPPVADAPPRAAAEPARPARSRPALAAASADAPALAAPPVASASAAAPPLPLLADLPAAWRSQLPSLVIAGGMYSEQADQRLLILNGQVVREGEQVAPGLKLEQIRPRSAVFSFQGQRFAMPM